MATQTKNNIESIRGMSYTDFIESKKNDDTLQFQFDPFFTNQRIFLKGFGKGLFYTCLLGYMIAPIIFVPLIAYKYDNWYLLFGIAFSYFSTFLALRKQQWQWAAPLLFMFWYWYKNGFHIDDYVNFFWLCLLWGGWMYSLAVGYEEEFAKVSILKDPDLFNELSQQGTIFFMRKTEKPQAENSQYHILMGRTKFEEDEFLEAIIHFDKAIELSPNYGNAYLNRALAKNKLDDYESAISDFDIAIQLSPKDGVGYFGRGLSNFAIGDKDAARTDWTKAGDLGFTQAYDMIKNMLT